MESSQIFFCDLREDISPIALCCDCVPPFGRCVSPRRSMIDAGGPLSDRSQKCGAAGEGGNMRMPLLRSLLVLAPLVLGIASPGTASAGDGSALYATRVREVCHLARPGNPQP